MSAPLAAFALVIFFALPVILAMLALTHMLTAAVAFVRERRTFSSPVNLEVKP